MKCFGSSQVPREVLRENGAAFRCLCFGKKGLGVGVGAEGLQKLRHCFLPSLPCKQSQFEFLSICFISPGKLAAANPASTKGECQIPGDASIVHKSALLQPNLTASNLSRATGHANSIAPQCASPSGGCPLPGDTNFLGRRPDATALTR